LGGSISAQRHRDAEEEEGRKVGEKSGEGLGMVVLERCGLRTGFWSAEWLVTSG
jgi:hypothetical protein